MGMLSKGDTISVLYWNSNWFKEAPIKSDNYTIKNFLFKVDADEWGVNRIDIPKEISEHLIIVTEMHSMTEEILDKIYEVRADVKIVYICITHEKHIFDGIDEVNEVRMQEWVSSRIHRLVSFHFRSPNLTFEPSLWMAAFDRDIPPFFYWFDRKGMKFLQSYNRFGIQIHRLGNMNSERISLLKELEGVQFQFHYPTFISVRGEDIGNYHSVLHPNTIAYYYSKMKLLFPTKIPHANKDLWWEETYKLFNQSLIEIVTETSIAETSTPPQLEKFTEKTLKPLLSQKPLMFSDPFSYRLWKDMGFQPYESIMGKELVKIFNEWDKPKGDYSYLIPFVKRLAELANMDEGSFERVYEDCLPLAISNRSILDNWTKWNEGVEKYFDAIPLPKQEEKVVEIVTQQQLLTKVRPSVSSIIRRR